MVIGLATYKADLINTNNDNVIGSIEFTTKLSVPDSIAGIGPLNSNISLTFSMVINNSSRTNFKTICIYLPATESDPSYFRTWPLSIPANTNNISFTITLDGRSDSGLAVFFENYFKRSELIKLPSYKYGAIAAGQSATPLRQTWFFGVSTTNYAQTTSSTINRVSACPRNVSSSNIPDLILRKTLLSPYIKDISFERYDLNNETLSNEGTSLICRKLSIGINEALDFSKTFFSYVTVCRILWNDSGIDCRNIIGGDRYYLLDYSESPEHSSNLRLFQGATFNAGSKYTLTFEFGDDIERVSQTVVVDRAFAKLHIAGASTGGVAIGMFSSAMEENPKFEVAENHRSIFYGPVEFLGDVSSNKSVGFTTVLLSNTTSSAKDVSETIPEIPGASTYICTGTVGWSSSGRPGYSTAPSVLGRTLTAHLAANSYVLFGVLGFPSGIVTGGSGGGEGQIGDLSNVTGVLAIGHGGTGATTATAALNNLGAISKADAITNVTVSGTTLSVYKGSSTSNPTTYTLPSGGGSFTGTLDVSQGGTGRTSLTAHSLLVGNGTSAVSMIGGSSTGVLYKTSTTSDPTFVSSLPVSYGGTGTTSLDANGILVGNGTNAIKVVGSSSVGAIYKSSQTTVTIGRLPISQGGTGGATAEEALSNLGGVSKTDAVTNVTFSSSNNRLSVTKNGSTTSYTLPTSSGGSSSSSFTSDITITGGGTAGAYPSLKLYPTYNSPKYYSQIEGSYSGTTSMIAWETTTTSDIRRMLKINAPSVRTINGAAQIVDFTAPNVAGVEYNIYHSGMTTAIPVTQGGTGATTAAAALTNLKAMPASYTSGESATGGTWIDGKLIYRYVWSGSVAGNGNRVVATIPSIVGTLLSSRGSIKNGDEYYNIPHVSRGSDTYNCAIYVAPGAGSTELHFAIGSSLTGTMQAMAIIEYTKG